MSTTDDRIVGNHGYVRPSIVQVDHPVIKDAHPCSALLDQLVFPCLSASAGHKYMGLPLTLAEVPLSHVLRDEDESMEAVRCEIQTDGTYLCRIRTTGYRSCSEIPAGQLRQLCDSIIRGIDTVSAARLSLEKLMRAKFLGVRLSYSITTPDSWEVDDLSCKALKGMIRQLTPKLSSRDAVSTILSDAFHELLKSLGLCRADAPTPTRRSIQELPANLTIESLAEFSGFGYLRKTRKPHISDTGVEDARVEQFDFELLVKDKNHATTFEQTLDQWFSGIDLGGKCTLTKTVTVDKVEAANVP